MLSQLRRALTPKGTLALVGGEGGDRWIGAVDRSIRALVVSPFVSQTLRPMFATGEHRRLPVPEEAHRGRQGHVGRRQQAFAERVPNAIRYHMPDPWALLARVYEAS